MSRETELDRVQIPNPCPASWDRMFGSEQIRFCTECNQYVYDLSKMTRDEADALIAISRDRLCARLTRTLDGSTVTADGPPPIQLMSRRVSPLAAAVVSAMMTLGPAGAAYGGTGSTTPAVYSASAEPGARPDLGDGPIALSGTISDSERAAIPRAFVSLINEHTGEAQTTISSQEGAYGFFLSKPGVYTLKVQAIGFADGETKGLSLGQGAQQRADLTLQAAPQVVRMSGAIAPAPTLPLRRLYEDSVLIIVARAAASKKIEKNNYAERIRTTLQISSTLKGDTQQKVYVYHWSYGDRSALPAGENLLLFLRPSTMPAVSKTQPAYELVDMRFGIKKLSDSDLSLYTQRIEELRQILQKDKPDKEEIVEWLVRCTEDPATRWEGAFDLAASSARLCQQIADADSSEEPDDSDDEEQPEEMKAESDEPADESAESIKETENLDDESMLAALLTANQKSRLMTALLKTEHVGEGDVELIRLAQTWRDPRLVPFLIAQLRTMQANPPRLCEELISAIAELIEDKAVTNLAERYSQEASYDDESEADDSNEKADAQGAPSASASNRSAMLRTFLSVVERKLSGRDAAQQRRR